MTEATPRHLLKLLSAREAYNDYAKYVNSKILPQESKILFDDYKKYFTTVPEKDQIDFDEFLALFQTQWHTSLSEEQQHSFRLIINSVIKTDVKDTEACLRGFFALDIQNKIQESWISDFDPQRIRTLLESYDRKIAMVSKELDTDAFTFEAINFNEIKKEAGLTWKLSSLQENLGSLIKGNFVVVGAYANTGKTAFVISQAVHTFEQINKIKHSGPILYFNSEGSLQDLWMRFFTNLYRSPDSEIIANETEVKQGFTRQFDPTKFIAYPVRGKNTGFIKTKLDKHKPSLVIIDLLDAVARPSNMNDIKADEEVYQVMRDLSNTYCPIIATCQAKASAVIYDQESQSKKPKRYLGLDELNFSNVGKQGAAEIVLMIGKDSSYKNERYINIAKCKRGKEVYFPCRFTGAFSSYEDF